MMPPTTDKQDEARPESAEADWIGELIYPFPSTFWRRITVQALDPELVYYGPLPQTDGAMRVIVGDYPRAAYVYVIQDVEGDVLYVGKTINPTGRFSKHRNTKDWWPTRGMLTLLGVWAPDRREADRVAFKLESIAIRDAGPRHNIAGVIR